MEERELRRIKKSFVRTDEQGCTEAACLLTVIKFYHGEIGMDELEEWCTVGGKRTIDTMKMAAIRAGMDARLDFMSVEQLSERKLPVILYAMNDFGKYDYAVCFGLHEGRFIVWEPCFGPMQYWPEELDTLWDWGVCMILYPGKSFVTKQPDMPWWELYGWSEKFSKKMETVKNFVELEVLPRLKR